jgi:hypothetical protein
LFRGALRAHLLKSAIEIRKSKIKRRLRQRYRETVLKRFKSVAEQTHGQIQSSDSVQNGELSVLIGRRLRSQSSTVCTLLYVDIFHDYARSAAH